MKSLLDPTFRYVPSNETDIRKTFARIRREMRLRERGSLSRDPVAGGVQNNLTRLFPRQKHAS